MRFIVDVRDVNDEEVLEEVYFIDKQAACNYAESAKERWGDKVWYAMVWREREEGIDDFVSEVFFQNG